MNKVSALNFYLTGTLLAFCSGFLLVGGYSLLKEDYDNESSNETRAKRIVQKSLGGGLLVTGIFKLSIISIILHIYKGCMPSPLTV